jgi:DNA polymerase IV
MSPKRRVILHVDMDAFYVAVETLLDPSLRGKPVIVGGDGARGVVASCSYEARAYGVRSAMASVRAKRLCPNAIFLRGNHGLYGEYSERIHEVFRSFTPHIEPIALDEAFLDLTGAQKLFGNGPEAARAVRAAVFDETKLACSVGVASNKFLAKLASKEAKPPIAHASNPIVWPVVPGTRRPSDGVLEVMSGHELAFLHHLPVRALWGVGPKTFEQLQRFGVQTIGDLAALPLETLVRALGPASGHHLHQLAKGVDDRPVESERLAKSIGHEETFSQDHFAAAALETELLRMADAVASRMRRAEVRGRTVQLKLKTSDFRLITRSRTLPQPIDTARPMHQSVVALLHADDVMNEVTTFGIRLIGVSMSNLSSDSAPDQRGQPEVSQQSDAVRGAVAEQLELFGTGLRELDDQPIEADPTLETANDLVLADTVDAIRLRFGAGAVGSAALARGARGAQGAGKTGKSGLRVKVAGDTQWGPIGSGGAVSEPQPKASSKTAPK